MQGLIPIKAFSLSISAIRLSSFSPSLSPSSPRYSAISVREKNGGVLVRKLLGREAPVVLDPTLLLPKETWNKLSEKAHWKKKCLQNSSCAICWIIRIIQDRQWQRCFTTFKRSIIILLFYWDAILKNLMAMCGT